jgi:hypothetical protein
MEPTWRIIIGIPKEAETKEAFRQLRMNTLNVWCLVSLALSGGVLWGIIHIVRQGGLDTPSVATIFGCLAAQVVPAYGIKRWRNHAQEVLRKRKAMR